MRTVEQDLNSLRKLVRELQQENSKLKMLLQENAIAFEQEDVFQNAEAIDEYDEDQGSRILPLKPDEQMAKEFFGMFWGRTDVYAKRGKNGGYFPQCLGRWNNPKCPKANNSKTFCDEDCEYKAWEPLEPWRIIKHIRGEKEDCTDVLGIYPLFRDNTCRLIVFDFDNHEKDAYKNDDANTDDLWKSEVDELRKICAMNGIDALTERSRSGKGAHVWILFREPIPAAQARSFGFALLDRGAVLINMPSFRYYDRMYPAQDVLSKLGNLVALPLQGRALKKGNSAFVDEAWNAYPDQWQALKSIRRLNKDEVAAFIQKWNTEAYEEPLITTYREDKKLTRPWRKDDFFHSNDVIGDELHIVLDDGVYVDALNLLPRIQNQIKSMATIDNPEFYKNLRTGRSNYYNFRAISMWSDTEGYIKIPRGILEKLAQRCDESKIHCTIEDNRSFGRPIRAWFKGQLREQQEFAAEKLEKYDNGVLCAATAFGKTVLAAYMISQRKVSTLILLEKQELIPQWMKELQEFLVIDEEPPMYLTKTGRTKTRQGIMGTLVGGTDKTTGIIDFAMVGSAYHKGTFFPNIGSYGMVLVDECHHAASFQAQEVLQHIRAKYVYGLSATPTRSDHLDPIIYMLLGPVRHRYTAKEQADEQGLGRYVYPRFTRVVNISGKELDIHSADALIAGNEVRNQLICEDVKSAVSEGRTPLILTKLKSHALQLSRLLIGMADHVFLIYGDQTAKENQMVREEMEKVSKNETLALVATGQKVGEGFNFPRLDTLMLAAPIKFEGRLTQYVGRLNRVYDGKTDVIVYDYVDSHIHFFDNQYKNRLSTYKKLGYQVISEVRKTSQQANVIYDRRDYAEVFERDLIEAEREIVISSPGLRRNKIERLIDLMETRQRAGVSVTVITIHPEETKYDDVNEHYALIDFMQRNGIRVRTTNVENEHYAIIDQHLVWHGGMNLLGKEDVWDNLIRVENSQAAAELMEISEMAVSERNGQS